MNIQLQNLIYSDFCNSIVSHLEFKDITSLRCVSTAMFTSCFPEHSISLILQKGGLQNLLRISLIFNHVPTFVDTIQKFLFKLNGPTQFTNSPSITKNLLNKIEIINIENMNEGSDIIQILDQFKNLKIANITTSASFIPKIQEYAYLEQLHITAAPCLHYAPDIFRCPKLQRIDIIGCILNEPPRIRECPNAHNLNYRTRPPERFMNF